MAVILIRLNQYSGKYRSQYVFLSKFNKFKHFSVPSQPERRKKWIAAIETHQVFNYHAHAVYVCQQHFAASAMIIYDTRLMLRSNVVPTIFPKKYVYKPTSFRDATQHRTLL